MHFFFFHAKVDGSDWYRMEFVPTEEGDDFQKNYYRCGIVDDPSVLAALYGEDNVSTEVIQGPVDTREFTGPLFAKERNPDYKKEILTFRKTSAGFQMPSPEVDRDTMTCVECAAPEYDHEGKWLWMSEANFFGLVRHYRKFAEISKTSGAALYQYLADTAKFGHKLALSPEHEFFVGQDKPGMIRKRVIPTAAQFETPGEHERHSSSKFSW